MTLNYYDLKFSLFPASVPINRMTLNYYDLIFLLLIEWLKLLWPFYHKKYES